MFRGDIITQIELPKEQKNIDKTDIIFILDRSGSMSGLEKETIGGFNSMIERQKSEVENAVVTTVIFDTEIETIHDGLELHSVPVLTEKEYYARGCTALLDAIGLTIKRVVKSQDESEDRPKKTLVVITTDGYENASQEYTYKTVRELIECKKNEGWEFLFLGANIDAIGEAAKFGIERNRAVEFYCDEEGVEKNFESISRASIRYCACKKIDNSWSDDIKQYCMKKKTKKQ